MNMKKYTVIAPVGDNIEALFIGIKEFPTEQVILLAPLDRMKKAKMACRDLERFKVPCSIQEIKDNVWEEMFRKIAELTKQLKGKDIIVNTATGDRMTTCAATSAAFVNGLKAFAVDGNNAMLLPVLKFSYYKVLSERKLNMLQLLSQDKTCCKSLEELSKKTRMSMPLVSYHIHGNRKSDGLVELGLVELTEEGGRLQVSLSTLGKLLIKGYVK